MSQSRWRKGPVSHTWAGSKGSGSISKKAEGGRIGLSHGTLESEPKVSKSKIKYKNGNKKKKSSYLGSGKKHIMKGKKWYQMDQT